MRRHECERGGNSRRIQCRLARCMFRTTPVIEPSQLKPSEIVDSVRRVGAKADNLQAGNDAIAP